MILDSLSFTATPLAPDGPDTMPRFAEVVKQKGVNFNQAYAPGPFSPSSHASFFTGKLPSKTGMYEAYPKFNGHTQTIADSLSDSHTTHLLTSNHFLFQGLDAGFDNVNDLGRQYMIFDDAADPKDFSETYNDNSRGQRYLDFIRSEGKPVRSFVNGLSYKFGPAYSEIKPKSWGDKENFQYVGTMCDLIRRQLLSTPDDTFTVANFMDLHAPFDVSNEALRRFFPDTPRDAIPLETPAR